MDFLAFSQCPRCGDQSLEYLDTYCHCFNCNYSNELDDRPCSQSYPSPENSSDEENKQLPDEQAIPDKDKKSYLGRFKSFCSSKLAKQNSDLNEREKQKLEHELRVQKEADSLKRLRQQSLISRSF